MALKAVQAQGEKRYLQVFRKAVSFDPSVGSAACP